MAGVWAEAGLITSEEATPFVRAAVSAAKSSLVRAPTTVFPTATRRYYVTRFGEIGTAPSTAKELWSIGATPISRAAQMLRASIGSCGLGRQEPKQDPSKGLQVLFLQTSLCAMPGRPCWSILCCQEHGACFRLRHTDPPPTCLAAPHCRRCCQMRSRS